MWRDAPLKSQTVTTAPGARGAYKVGDPYQVAGLWYYPAVDYDYDETGIASWYGSEFEGKPTANGETFRMNELTAAHRTLPMPSLVRVINLENGRALALRVNDRGPFSRGRIIDVSRRAAQLLGFERNGTARVRVQSMADESRALALRSQAGAQVAELPPGAQPDAAPLTAVVAVPLSGPQTAVPAAASSEPPQRTTAIEVMKPDGRVYHVPVRPTQLFIQAGAFTEQHNAARLRAKLAPYGATKVAPIRVGAQQFYRVRLGPIATLAEADRILTLVLKAGIDQARVVVD